MRKQAQGGDMTDPESKAGLWKSQGPESQVPLPLARGEHVLSLSPLTAAEHGPRELASHANETEGAASCQLRPSWADGMVFPLGQWKVEA